MDKVMLKNGFKKYYIELEYKGEITLDPNKYKSIRLKKSEGDWPDEMWIYWDKGNFDFIFMENIRHKKKNKSKVIKFKFKKPICKQINPKEIDEFEIQIKRTSAKETEQGIVTTNDPDTTVTIGDAKDTESPVNKKKKG